MPPRSLMQRADQEERGLDFCRPMHTRSAFSTSEEVPRRRSRQFLRPHHPKKFHIYCTLPFLQAPRRCDPRASLRHAPRLFLFAMPRYSAAHLPFPKRAFTIQMKDQSVLRLLCWRTWRPREEMPIQSRAPDLKPLVHILGPPARSVQNHMAVRLPRYDLRAA